LIDFLSDRKILIGIGIGMIIATLVMGGVKINLQMSNAEVEKKARGLGMDYPTEFKVLEKKGVSK
jgi:uncharacterized membrane protein YciS (DUF1049 family)